MADQIQLRGGTEAENNAFTGAAREVTVDTTNNTLRVHDGTTAGGHYSVSLPQVSTGGATNITKTTADFSGEVIGSGNAVTERGVVYATTELPNLNDNKVADATAGAGTFSVSLTGLTAETKYYVRGYATTANGTSYGSQAEFTTDFAYAIGDTGPAGGLIFFVDINNEYDFTYLESSTVDQSTGDAWSDNNTTNIPLTSMDLGQGSRNTDVVIAGSTTSAALTASEYSSNGFTDWFLPSRDELNLMYTNLHCQGLGSFAADNYWSSSQYNSSNAWRQNFNNGNQNNNAKSNSYRVRAVRLF
ncbi:MAG: DUF1566 domain-containing protein [Candidatus Saccharimonadales bacterium]